MSRAIATTILRKFSACRSSFEVKLIFESLVTPSTRKATSSPNSCSMSSSVAQRVLDHVVEQAGADAGGVEPELGDDAGDGCRMDEVRIAALALLALRAPARCTRRPARRSRRRRTGDMLESVRLIPASFSIGQRGLDEDLSATQNRNTREFDRQHATSHQTHATPAPATRIAMDPHPRRLRPLPVVPIEVPVLRFRRLTPRRANAIDHAGYADAVLASSRRAPADRSPRRAARQRLLRRRHAVALGPGRARSGARGDSRQRSTGDGAEVEVSRRVRPELARRRPRPRAGRRGREPAEHRRAGARRRARCSSSDDCTRPDEARRGRSARRFGPACPRVSADLIYGVAGQAPEAPRGRKRARARRARASRTFRPTA